MDALYLEIAKPYFEQNKKLESLFVTKDKQVFYPEAQSFLRAYVKQNKVEFVQVKKEDLSPPKVSKPVTKSSAKPKEEDNKE